jgi:hypothetical protein
MAIFADGGSRYLCLLFASDAGKINWWNGLIRYSKSEALYVRFENDSYVYSSISALSPGDPFRFRFDADSWTANVGVNYRFGSNSLTARY